MNEHNSSAMLKTDNGKVATVRKDDSFCWIDFERELLKPPHGNRPLVILSFSASHFILQS